tara:strand:- start:690 stop:1130 length:441 start_codon:yes stop_codon:yes gene_type:complete
MDLTFYQNTMNKIYFINIKNNTSNKEIINKVSCSISNITSNILNVTDSIIEKKNSEIDNKLSETDEGYFYKPWNKMSTVHKIIKIKQFVNNMNIENDKKSKLITYLKTALKKKIISKNDQVIYNISQAKIVSIPKLELKNNSFSIN